MRGLSPDDAAGLFGYRSDPAVAEFQTFRPASIEDAIAFIRDSNPAFNQEGSWFQLGIYLKGTLIGDIGIHFLDPRNLQCEIGYTIAKRHWRRGFGKEAVARVVTHLFADLGKHRVSASLDPANLASAALLESLGFRKEGLFRKSILNGEEWEDDLVYAILAEEWKPTL